jgi:signal transduction histidine kinase
MTRLRPVLVVTGVTTLVSIVAVTRHHFQMMEGNRPPSYLTWPHAIVQEVPYYVLWALAVPLVLWFVRRLARASWPLAATIAAHLAFAAIVIGTETMVTPLVQNVLDPQPHGSLGEFLINVLEASPSHLSMYAAILGLVMAYEYYGRAVRRELGSAALAAELAEARLGALRAQLHPHFVFNALNSVAMLVRGHRNDAAVDAIARLSDLLRDTLQDDARAEVTLDEELAFVRRYLAIEALRFGDRLRVTFDVPPALGDARVPRLVLQPLVENAIRHGLGRRAAAGRVTIAALRDDERLLLTVRDDGPGLHGESSAGADGVGLANTRNRLAALYGDRASLALATAAEGGAVVTVSLPLARAAAA